jgi:hypothetical protein
VSRVFLDDSATLEMKSARNEGQKREAVTKQKKIMSQPFSAGNKTEALFSSVRTPHRIWTDESTKGGQ